MNGETYSLGEGGHGFLENRMITHHGILFDEKNLPSVTLQNEVLRRSPDGYRPIEGHIEEAAVKGLRRIQV